MITQPYYPTLPQPPYCSLPIAHFELIKYLNQFSQLSIQATSVQELDLVSLIGQQGLFSIQAVSWANYFLRTIVPFSGRNHIPFDFI